MKTLFFVALVSLAGSSAFSWPTYDPYQICDQLNVSDDREKCLTVVEGHYFYPYATVICSKLMGSSDRIECLQKISDKKYTRAEAQTCGYLLTDGDQVDCLERSGHSP